LKVASYVARFGFDPRAAATSGTPVLRQDEKAIISRLRVSF
jgi:hypothetical protein